MRIHIDRARIIEGVKVENTPCPCCGAKWNTVPAWTGTVIEDTPTGQKFYVPNGGHNIQGDMVNVTHWLTRKEMQAHAWNENNSYCQRCFDNRCQDCAE